MNTPLKNAKHEHFAQLVSNGETAPRAYVLAGYSEKGARQSAHALLTKPDVSDRVSALRRKKEEKHERAVETVLAEAAMDKAWVLKKLGRIVDMGMSAEAVKDAAGELARPGMAVFMDGDAVVSRRRIKSPQYEQLRHHGRGKPDAFVYVGRNDANEHVFQLVSK